MSEEIVNRDDENREEVTEKAPDRVYLLPKFEAFRVAKQDKGVGRILRFTTEPLDMWGRPTVTHELVVRRKFQYLLVPTSSPTHTYLYDWLSKARIDIPDDDIAMVAWVNLITDEGEVFAGAICSRIKDVEFTDITS